MCLNQNSSKLGGFVQAFGPLLGICNHVVLVHCITFGIQKNKIAFSSKIAFCLKCFRTR